MPNKAGVRPLRDTAGEISTVLADGERGDPRSTLDMQLARPDPSHELWLILSDIHFPWHNDELINAVCRMVRESRPRFNGIVLNGDILDMYSLGKYNADSLSLLREWDLGKEYAVGRQLIHRIDQSLDNPDATRVFIYGNHEDRYFRELERGDRGKYAGALESPESALRLRELGYAVLDQWKDDTYTIGNSLQVTHGLWTPVHAAKKHLDEFAAPVLFGHTHRFQVFGLNLRVAWNVGFMGDKTSRGFSYAPGAKRRQWTNSFAVAAVNGSTGAVAVHPILCAPDGSFYFNGRFWP